MPAITPASLMTLESYAKARRDFRAKVIAHKKNRTIHLGSHLTLLFEDELTIRYQVQEMLRIEKIFEEDGIRDELEAYNPLIPDGRNWKATLLIEYEEPDLRKQMLTRLIGVEDRIWARVTGFGKVFAIADEDMERAREDKTSSVHFLRFELSPEMITALGRGADVAMGVDHPEYQITLAEIDPVSRQTLVADFSPVAEAR